MADQHPDEIIAQLATLRQRAQELFTQHNRVHQDLSEVLAKMEWLNAKRQRPNVAIDSLERR